jgi:PAS domain S-box-containing protein
MFSPSANASTSSTAIASDLASQPKPVKADILVIDDTPENLHLISNLLSDRGYKVRCVTKGSTGLLGAIAAPPDLILLDINMPQLNGYQLCEQLKTNEITRDIPVIFISALGDVLDKVKAFNVGGVDFITKPFQIEEVLARIQTHLALRRLQQQQQAQNLRLQQEIDERRRAEETFEKSFLASPSPIAITTLSNGTFLAVNPSFLKMSGYAPNKVIGQTTADLALWRSPDLYQQAIAQVSEGNPIYSQELECQTLKGELLTVLVSIEQISLRGEPCALNIINDITERKRLENEFISVVSHELRTPMHSLIGALDLLSTGELGELTSQGSQILSVATSNAERLIRLVNDILDLERLKSGKMLLNKVSCEVDVLFTQAIEAMQVMADEAQVTLHSQTVHSQTVHSQTASLQIVVDCDRILQTLTNLLSNAIKFSHPGGHIWLVATLETSEQPQLHITVTDQGRGIPPAQLETIFERFQQVDASDSRRKGGTGLGLAICRKILQEHEGKIWAESTLQQGSTFHILLPL